MIDNSLLFTHKRDKKQVGTNDKLVTQHIPRDTEKENFCSNGIYYKN